MAKRTRWPARRQGLTPAQHSLLAWITANRPSQIPIAVQNEALYQNLLALRSAG